MIRQAVWLRALLVGSIVALSSACAALEPVFGETGLACQQPPEGDWSVLDREVPELIGLQAAEAAEALHTTGIDASWRYSYNTSQDRRGGYGECWCVAPPDGAVQDVITTDEGWLIVFVAREAPIIGGRPQPRLGWGCESAGPYALTKG